MAFDSEVPFGMSMCNAIIAQVKDYGDRPLLASCNVPWVCIYGDSDPFYVEKDLLDKNLILMTGVGHYPFLEDSYEFIRATNKAEEILCQKRKVEPKN